MVFNATFNNISAISWQASFIGGGNWSMRRKPPTCRKSLTTLYHIMLYRVHPRHELPDLKLVTLGTDCSGSCKSNYHTITTTTSKRHEKDMKRKVTVDSVGYHV